MATNNESNWNLSYSSSSKEKEAPQLRAVNKVISLGAEAKIPEGCRIIGNVQLSGLIQIDGEIEGDIVSTGEIIIGETAIINANIATRRIKASGLINGDISAEERLELCRGACVKGNLYSPRIAIQDGVVFGGRCVMPSPEKREISDVHSFNRPAQVQAPVISEEMSSETARSYVQETFWKLEQ
ncbi:MAG: polymer-forming cytoskeletal protein [Deltaproteobacteria bacterium]|nr:polymer-forming cytoskeletal protein [Deltaproteobacteria bacterium]